MRVPPKACIDICALLCVCNKLGEVLLERGRCAYTILYWLLEIPKWTNRSLGGSIYSSGRAPQCTTLK